MAWLPENSIDSNTNIPAHESIKKNILHIGCSGFYYSSWKNTFYPEHLPTRDWLEYYSSIFNSVELNSTFYRKPQLKTLQRYAKDTPPGFLFSVKMSRYITHILKMRKCRDAVREIQDVAYEGLREKLGAFLFQLPATYKYGAENLECVLATVPAGQHNVVEFRHPSWWNDDVQDAFTRAGITFCNVDYPGLESFYMSTTETFYLRLHGTPELFKSRYSIEQLKKFMKASPVDAKQYFVYFNNTYYEGAYTNAAEIREIMQRQKVFMNA